MIEIAPHPLLRPFAFTSDFSRALGDSPSPEWLAALLRADATALLRADATAPLAPDEAVRSAVRALLRHGGFKPSGRSKPASEYLTRAAADATLASINLAVDACNVVSLHSGLPISVVDLDRVAEPLRIRICAAGEAYVFNASGHVIDLEGLLCLCDAAGPCANAVKDAQRTKTSDTTRRTLSVIWGAAGLEERIDTAQRWYREILGRAGAKTEAV